ncbi:hypothetical protein HZC08_01875 [Candidatus Micrarchaeota archaeon]|nr:hypothetical protein [Candidatus Micrarchaeota archaeon]
MGKATRLKKERADAQRQLQLRLCGYDDRPFLVATSLGNTILDPNSKVYVRVGEKQVIEKSVSDLKEGEQVIYEKSGIDLGEHRETIDTKLREGRRFRAAASELFVELTDGSTTRFRVELLGGVSEKSESWPDSLTSDDSFKAKIKFEGADLAVDQYREAAETVHNELERNSARFNLRVVTEAHIRNGWLTGNVIAPLAFEKVFSALAEISPGIGRLTESGAFKKAYKLYIAMKESIAQRLTKIMHGSSHAEHTEEKPRSVSFLDADARRELDEIVNSFADNLSTVYAVATVFSKRQLKKTEVSEPQFNTPKLRKGVTTKKPIELELEVLTSDTILKRTPVLSDVVGYILDYYRKMKFPDQSSSSMKEIVGYSKDALIELFGYAGFKDHITWAIAKMKEAGLDTYSYGQDRFDVEPQCAAFSKGLYQSLLSGEMDGWFGLEQGATMRLVKEYARCIAAKPLESLYVIHLSNLIQYLENNDRDTRQARNEYETAAKLSSRKGYHRGAEYLTPMCMARELVGNRGSIDELLREGCIDDREALVLISQSDYNQLDLLFERLIRQHPDLFNLRSDKFLFKSERDQILRGMALLRIYNRVMSIITGGREEEFIRVVGRTSS